MNNNCCVYLHTNILNGKRYVGITSQDPEKRWLNGHGYSRDLPFGRAIEKYGWGNFEHRILLRNLSAEEARCMETYFIGLLNTQNRECGYNMTAGGDGLNGYHHSSESKAKMSLAKSGENHPGYGKHMSKETRDKIAKRLIGNKNSSGKIRSDKTRRKMAQAKSKPVIMLDRHSGSFVSIFESAKEAERITGISRKNISLCCLGQRKIAGGYSWKFCN